MRSAPKKSFGFKAPKASTPATGAWLFRHVLPDRGPPGPLVLFSYAPLPLGPLGERLGEGVIQETVFRLTPSPNLYPKGERNMTPALCWEPNPPPWPWAAQSE
jgi:hypothetical protein